MFIMALMFITLDILDSYNPAMGFLTSSIVKWLLAIFCVAASFGAITMILRNRKRE
jgi:hypothetical protein